MCFDFRGTLISFWDTPPKKEDCVGFKKGEIDLKLIFLHWTF